VVITGVPKKWGTVTIIVMDVVERLEDEDYEVDEDTINTKNQQWRTTMAQTIPTSSKI